MNYCYDCRVNHNYNYFDSKLKMTCSNCFCSLPDIRNDIFQIKCNCSKIIKAKITDIKQKIEYYSRDIGGCEMEMEIEHYYTICTCGKEVEIKNLSHRQKCYIVLVTQTNN